MFKIRDLFPRFLFNKLWGERAKWGLDPVESDPSWIEWQKMQHVFYKENQRKGIGTVVNDSGYKIMSEIDMHNKYVLEIGPGDMRHQKFWNSKPTKYLIADIHKNMMQTAENIFENYNINFDSYLVSRNDKLPITKNSIDIIITFYSLEHLHPLEDYIEDMKYYLKPDGIIVGAIPAEGGLLWALGRFLTSRRWLHKNTTIDYDKLICWEHPNYTDYIIKKLDQNFQRVFLKSWPLRGFPILDCNLTFSFCYKNCTK